MQGNELLPCHRATVRRAASGRAPHTDAEVVIASLDALLDLGQVPSRQIGLDRGGIDGCRVGGDVDQRRLQPLGFRVAEFEVAEFLEMIVQQPGMIDRGLQNQRLAQRRTEVRKPRCSVPRRHLLADDDIRRVA